VTSPEESEVTEEYDEPLTFEEENAVHYVGGYVVHSLKLNERNKDIHQILEDFTDSGSSSKDGLAQEWVNAVDRGGPTHHNRSISIFIAIETCTRSYLKVSKATEMSKEFRKSGQDESDEVCQKCMMQFVEKWITIRGFSFVNNIMEMYKQSEKKGTVKSKSLHSKLFT